MIPVNENYPIRWLLDSGASGHFTNNLDDFIEYDVGDFGSMGTAEAGKTLYITAYGSVMIEHEVTDEDTGNTLKKRTTIPNVKYVKGLMGRILSPILFSEGNNWTMVGRAAYTMMYKHDLPVLTAQRIPTQEDRLHYVLTRVVKIAETSYKTARLITYDIWHQRFGHISETALSKVPKATEPKVEIPSKTGTVCPGCALGKQTQKPFYPNPKRAKKLAELTHSDLLELPITSYHKFKWVITFLDDYSSNCSIFLLKQKSEATQTIKDFVTGTELMNNTKCLQFRTDNGGEYMPEELARFFRERGIIHETTAPYAHQQNGRAERLNRTLLEKAQAMRLHACLPDSYWEFAIRTAVHVYNRTPMRRLNWKTPTELHEGIKPKIDHLRVFGCVAYVFIPEEKRQNKLTPRSEYMTFVGYIESGYIFLRQRNNRALFVSPTAIFDEGIFPLCPNGGIGRIAIPREPETSTDDLTSNSDNNAPEPSEQGSVPSFDLDPSLYDPNEPDVPPRPTNPTPPRSEPPRSRSPSNKEASDDDDHLSYEDFDPSQKKEVHFRPTPPPNTPSDLSEDEVQPPTNEKGKMPERRRLEREIILPETFPPRRSTRTRQPPLRPDNIYGERSNPTDIERQKQQLHRLASEGGKDFINLLLANAITPVTYKDLDNIPQDDQKAWIEACIDELRALKKRGVYEIVDLPEGRKTVKNRWVFNIKSDGRKRARLVAKGFSQIEGIDFNELFSPVVRYETARLIFGVAALEDWEIESVDVKAAYLYGKLEEEIYMEQPEGFRKDNDNRVWRLHRALYGLKQSGLAWWRELTADPQTKQLIIALVYVDDVAIIGKKTALFINLKRKIMNKWECRDLGETKEFLGINIQRDRKNRRIFLNQENYLEKILEKFDVTSKPTKTPLKSGFTFVPFNGSASPAFRQKYQQLVGSLMYLMIGTRPDIAYATVKLSQQCANPAQEYYDQGLYVLRYLLGSRHYRLKFHGASNEALVAYSDSDWAQDPTNRKSVTGNYVTIAKGCVSWLSRKQKTVASSSTEAEYMALSDCSKQLVWMSQLLKEIGFDLPSPYLNADNEGSIFWASNPVQERRSKHIDI
ncbi:hypothetical protein Agabi119p4_9813 [Agaricus bisporus var. burnettii]|uniref:Integrase catalytic domain-containing protein n=1 Tax=Agaricus bisporus var. burnettii TaxID=192524 RepID=A0A8H7C3R9_AGABI|nr:hypothetical protein Agabi119p4_9813 [Agaricus bisporus var. burnettii]